MLEVEWMLFCEEVSARPDGRHNLMGIGDIWRTAKPPLVVKQMVIVVSLLYDRDLEGLLSATITRGKKVIGHFPTAFQVEGLKKGEEPKGAVIPFQLPDIELPAFGKYTVEIKFGDEVLHTGRFFLRKKHPVH